MGTDTDLRQEAAEVVSWRRDRLIRAGFPFRTAVRLSRDPRYDLHGLVDLAGRGCPPDLAARILAPLDEDGAA